MAILSLFKYNQSNRIDVRIRDGTVKIITTLTVKAMLTLKKKYSGRARNKSGGGAKKKYRGNAPYAPPLATRLSKTFFFDLHVISREKHFNFLRRLFFWSSLTLGDGITLISLKYFLRPNAFGLGCKSVPPCKQ